MKQSRILIFLFALVFVLQMPCESIAQDRVITRPSTQQRQTQPAQRQRQNQNRQRQQQHQTQPAQRQQQQPTVTDPVLKNLISNMVRVEGGTFTMGATSEQGSEADSDEKPAHQVTVSSFSIGRYEVTQEEWQAVMGSLPPNMSDLSADFKGAKLPVVRVSWNECQEFIRKLNAKTGRNFRLPTEAEWEFAARGGNRSNHYKYSGSNYINDVAWFTDNSGGHPHAVGGKQANELGLYDMSGNVYEWCSDWYGSYSSSSQTNPAGSVSGEYRVHRGGGWYYFARICRVSIRRCYAPDYRSDSIGLRLAE